MDGQRTKRRRNIGENFSRLSRTQERYRRQTDRQTDNDIANVNVSSRSLKMDMIKSRACFKRKIKFVSCKASNEMNETRINKKLIRR